MINIAFEYRGNKYYIRDERYGNGRLALTVSTISNTKGVGPLFCVLTTNLDGVDLADGEFFIKTWSENENITNYLRDSGIFTDTGKRVRTGFTHAEVWKFKEHEEEEKKAEDIDVEPEPLRRR